MKPSSRRAIVVLPEPDSPATAVEVGNSLGTIREASRSATVVLAAVLRIPLWKTLVTLRSSSSGVLHVSGPFGGAARRDRIGRGRLCPRAELPAAAVGPSSARARRRAPPARRRALGRTRPPSRRSSPPSARPGRAGPTTGAAAARCAPDRDGRPPGGPAPLAGREGSRPRQRSKAKGQRGWNAHRSGRLRRAGGSPGMPISLPLRGGSSATAAAALRVAEREQTMAHALVAGKTHADEELNAFYQKVLPSDLTAARRLTYARAPGTRPTHQRPVRNSAAEIADPEKDARLGRLRIRMVLQGDYETFGAISSTSWSARPSSSSLTM